MSYIIVTDTDTNVPNFLITAAHYVRACTIPWEGETLDFSDIVGAVDWLRGEVSFVPGSDIQNVSITAVPDDLQAPTVLTLTIEWTPPVVSPTA